MGLVLKVLIDNVLEEIVNENKHTQEKYNNMKQNSQDKDNFRESQTATIAKNN